VKKFQVISCNEIEVVLLFSLCCRETTALWVSIDVPSAQPQGQYEGEFFITAIKAEAE
jgi:hypothetical protein